MLSYGLHPRGCRPYSTGYVEGCLSLRQALRACHLPRQREAFFFGSLFEGAAELARLREFTPSVSPSASHLPRRGRLFHWLPLTRELSAALPLTEGETGFRALGQGVRPFRIGGGEPLRHGALRRATSPFRGGKGGWEITSRRKPRKQLPKCRSRQPEWPEQRPSRH